MTAQELDSLVTMFRSRPQPENPTPEFLRRRFEKLASLVPPPADIEKIPVDAGGVPAEWVRAPGAGTGRAVLYLHGGGYVIGSVPAYRGHGYNLSRAADARVLLVEYRLAPEHPHPAAVEDAVAAWRWLLDQGVAPGRAAIAGDSAGGGLTLAALVAIRDRGLPLPAGAVCFSPWVDLEGTGESLRTRAEADPMVARAGLDLMAKHYLGGGDPRAPLAAPLHADLSGLPPLLVQVGDAEILLDDSTRIVERARAAGVDATLEVWPDMIHIFPFFADILTEGRDALDRAGAFIRAHTA